VVRRRLLYSSLAAAVVVAVAGGWAWAQVDDDDTTTPTATFPAAGDTVAEPGIPTNAPVTGEAFPDVEVVGPDGATVSTATLVGRPMVVNVWYSTCPPCRRELPAFADVAAERGDEVAFVGINPRDDQDTARSFADEQGITYDTYRDPDGVFLAAAGVATFPSTLFVASDGTIVEQHAGELTADELVRIIDEELIG
jgi:thiol-disulfide isomerase/thioredoxin